MIIATVHLHNGTSYTVRARNHTELFATLDTTQIAGLTTREAKVGDIRQGKDNYKKQEGTAK